ncbi:DUF308 domain-containing protein [Methanobacterium sp. ACI-7]|uniref:DUF308 domain-containing protein n=1 Tax=unclassified Methanobacterium TaxID=2627676 RepID=UPI0039C380B7
MNYIKFLMSKAEDTLRGIIAIIVGVFLISILFTKIFTINQSLGMGIAFLGIWMLVLSYDMKEFNRNESILYFILFLISIITGLFLYINVSLPGVSLAIWTYITGIIILTSGIIAIMGNESLEKGTGIAGILLGIIFLILAYLNYNLFIMAIITGIWLIIIGIVQFYISYDQEYQYGFYRLF